MKKLISYIIESKDDNLHQFVDYLNETGKEGTLKSSVNSISDLYYKADLENCNKFNNCCIDECWLFEFFMEQNGLDPYDEVEDWEAYYNYVKEYCEDSILGELDINSDGCIYIEREIGIPKFGNNDGVLQMFKKEFNGKLGKYWTFKEGNAESYNSTQSDSHVVMCAYVRPEDVDWAETIASNIADTEECELTLTTGCDIEINTIKTSDGNHKIFNKKLIFKC